MHLRAILIMSAICALLPVAASGCAAARGVRAAWRSSGFLVAGGTSQRQRLPKWSSMRQPSCSRRMVGRTACDRQQRRTVMSLTGRDGRPFPQSIRLVASDLDGTLLDTSCRISERTVESIRRLKAKGYLFVPATGKSRSGMRTALGALGQEVLADGPGGVYLQGLQVYQGHELIFERRLEPSVALEALRFARDTDTAIVAFSTDRVLCERMCPLVATVPKYHEPHPEVVPLEECIRDHHPVHKMILLGDPARIAELRPQLAQVLGGTATLTQAQGDMLEVLPLGGSKGEGVRRLLSSLGVAASDVLAIGDAENDLEMLKMAGWAVAMGNGSARVKEVADVVVASNNEDGAAQAFDRFCSQPPRQAAN